MNKPFISAKKSLGQNFLVDANTIWKIVNAIDPQQGEDIIEIGPGQGAITKDVLATGAHVHALEKDPRMEEVLKGLPNAEKLTIHMGDALQADLANITPNVAKLVGNLPYNVGTQILFNALQTPHKFSKMVFMLQKEVVERITAKPNTSDWGRLGIWCDLLCERKRLFDVPPGAFRPQPKITSAIVELRPLDKPRYDVDFKKLEIVLTSSFGQRRKMLRASLKGKFTSEQLESLRISPECRPETLSTEEFCKLANAL